METLDGDNKYDAGEYGLQVSVKLFLLFISVSFFIKLWFLIRILLQSRRALSKGHNYVVGQISQFLKIIQKLIPLTCTPFGNKLIWLESPV